MECIYPEEGEYSEICSDLNEKGKVEIKTYHKRDMNEIMQEVYDKNGEVVNRITF
ncbi:MAG: hypothetical protein ACJ75J_14465 [Cytophagaceae bacterium]